jgi:hypothetical protein
MCFFNCKTCNHGIYFITLVKLETTESKSILRIKSLVHLLQETIDINLIWSQSRSNVFKKYGTLAKRVFGPSIKLLGEIKTHKGYLHFLELILKRVFLFHWFILQIYS